MKILPQKSLTLEQKFIGFYQQILSTPIRTNTKSIMDCVLRSLLREVGRSVCADSMRLYFFEFDNGVVIERSLLGDQKFWRTLNVNYLRKDVFRRKGYCFIKIRHTDVNGKYYTIGYIALYRSYFWNLNEINYLNLLGLHYGNYISTRLVRSRILKNENIIGKLYSLLTSVQKPGSIILGTLQLFQKLLNFYSGYYCTFDDNNLYIEYIVKKNKHIIMKEHKAISISSNFILDISHSYIDVDNLPLRLQKFIFYKTNESSRYYYAKLHPINYDGNVIGIWITVFHKSQFTDIVDIKTILKQIEPLIQNNYKYLYQRRTCKMVVNPIFKERDTRVNHNMVFVIMPFKEEWSNSVYNHIIKPSVESLGMTAIRADDLYGQNIMEDVWKGILQSAIIIADTTGRNPNVFYELGMAHAIGKNVILLTQNVDDIPFDLTALRHIIYKADISGGEKLKTDLKKFINESLK